MSSLDDLIRHPYKKKIDDMCLKDEAVTKIVSWVKHTVDEDADIPEDKKREFYITYGKVNDYKKLHREKMGEMAAAISGPTGGELVNPEDVTVNYGENAVNLKIIEEDAAKQLINTIQTFSNLAKQLEERASIIKQKLDTDGDSMAVKDLVGMEKNLRGYFVEMRNLMKDYNQQTGAADFFKKLGEGLGAEAAKNVIDKKKEGELKKFITDLLREIDDVDKIPRYIQRFEEIINHE